MDAVQTLGPLLGVVLGGLLTGITSYFKSRSERKRVIAVALADLLEVRHRLVSADLVVQALRARIGVQPEQLPPLRNLIDSLVPGAVQLDERYDKAVTMLSTIDPVLGFSLRSKNALPHVLAALRSQATSGGTNLAQYEAFETALRTAATPSLNAAVAELARAHSVITWFKVRRLTAKSSSLPLDVSRFFDTLKSDVLSESNHPPEG
jgi:hypothetical protein